MIATRIDLEPHTEGTTWEGITAIGPVSFTDGVSPPVPPSAALSEVWCQIRRGSASGSVVATFRNEPNVGELPINVIAPLTWECVIPPVAPEDFPVVVGQYHYSLKVKDADGIVYPVYEGVLVVQKVSTNTSEMEATPPV